MTHYSIQPYSPDWAVQFNELKQELLYILGDKVISIEHVGSTSVPGMKSKPAIDVLVFVEGLDDIRDEIQTIKSKEYVVRENVLAENSLLLEKTSGDVKTENIHVFEKDDFYAQNHFINIRDYLRSHPEVVKEYEELKDGLYKKYPDDYQAYREGKDEFLKRLEKLAEEDSKCN